MFRKTKDVDEIQRCRIEFRMVGSKHGIQLPAMQESPAGYSKELRLLEDDVRTLVMELKRRVVESPEHEEEIAMIAQQILQQYESLRGR